MTLNQPMLFLATRDPVRTRAFYEDSLGLTFVSEDPFALVFHVGDSMLRIQKVNDVYAPPYTSLGWTVGDLRQSVRALVAKGVQFNRYDGVNQDADAIWTSPSGAQIAWFNDPDGHILSLTQFS